MPDPPVRLIRAGSLEPELTQGLYHSIALGMKASSADTIILCCPSSPYLCIGYHQILDAVLDTVACNNLKLPIMRRRVGGGTTYLDRNQIFYQCVFHHSRVPVRANKVYQMMLAAPVKVVNRLGLQGRLWAVNEVEANGLRIAGIGGGRIGDAVVVVGNLLLDFEYETMSRVWRVPHEAFRRLALKTLEERVSTLKKQGCNQTPGSLETLLEEAYAESLERSLQETELSPKELEEGRKTARHLGSPEFLSQHRPEGTIPPMKSIKISADVYIHALALTHEGKFIKFAVRSDHGKITDVKFDQNGTEVSAAFKQKILSSSFESLKDMKNDNASDLV